MTGAAKRDEVERAVHSRVLGHPVMVDAQCITYRRGIPFETRHVTCSCGKRWGTR